VVALAGGALLSGASWARWFTIVVASLNFIVQLGFLGSAQCTLWDLLGAIQLTAFTVHHRAS
jgi:hypothetical protein